MKNNSLSVLPYISTCRLHYDDPANT
ncbi:uncharacterized protein METZ01_LOCUS387674, partial [marine metagenome]